MVGKRINHNEPVTALPLSLSSVIEPEPAPVVVIAVDVIVTTTRRELIRKYLLSYILSIGSLQPVSLHNFTCTERRSNVDEIGMYSCFHVVTLNKSATMTLFSVLFSTFTQPYNFNNVVPATVRVSRNTTF